MTPADNCSDNLIIFIGGILTSKYIHTGAADRRNISNYKKKIHRRTFYVISCQPLAPDH